ncbi:MAG: ABC transporter permease [Chloroflexi bacterium]|nr:ABC transporter permease [Chloroflexota bacterium]
MAEADLFAARRGRRKTSTLAPSRRLIVSMLGLAVGTALVWQMVYLIVGRLIVASPVAVAQQALALLGDGTLLSSISISYGRVLLGWTIGSALSVPLGLLMARVLLVRRVFDPYLHFFRFVPPIALVTVFLIWLGIGEESKVALIIYTTGFTGVIAAMHGALSVDPIKIRAAQCLGASDRQVLLWVIIPASVPHIVTGLRIAMGSSFATIIAAEMIAARSGVGFLIWDARAYMETEKIYLGLLTLSFMGLTADLVFRLLMRPIAYRFNVKM